MSEVLIRVVGPVEIEKDGMLVPTRGTSRRRVLAFLAARRGFVVSVDELAEVAGGSPGAVRTLVSRLRKEVGGDLIRTHGTGYALARDGCDSVRMERLLDASHATSGHGALELTEAALAFRRGRAFGDMRDEWWAQPEAARIEEIVAAAVEQRADLLITLGRLDEAIAILSSHVLLHPLRDRPHRSLMFALHCCGRTTEALRHYQEYRERLCESGTEPSPATTALDRSIATGLNISGTG